VAGKRGSGHFVSRLNTGHGKFIEKLSMSTHIYQISLWLDDLSPSQNYNLINSTKNLSLITFIKFHCDLILLPVIMINLN
jgi:hypothetical protein